MTGVEQAQEIVVGKKSRKINKRRDRRKAKQSGWKRGPKTKPKKIGHGPN